MAVQVQIVKSEISTPDPKEQPDLIQFEFVGEFLGATPLQHDLIEFLSNHQDASDVSAFIGRLPSDHDGVSFTVQGSLKGFADFKHLRELQAQARQIAGASASEAQVDEILKGLVKKEVEDKLAAQVDSVPEPAKPQGDQNGQSGNAGSGDGSSSNPESK
jgi:hypothetical protein